MKVETKERWRQIQIETLRFQDVRNSNQMSILKMSCHSSPTLKLGERFLVFKIWTKTPSLLRNRGGGGGAKIKDKLFCQFS